MEKFEFYKNSATSWEAMLVAIKNAKKSILLEQFIFLPDFYGEKFLDALVLKAKEGVSVKILCDHAGSFSLSKKEIVKELNSSGVEIRFFNPIFPWSPHQVTFWYFRNHRKLLVVDDSLGFTGSVCIGEEMRNWRETYVEVTGEAVKDMVESFFVMWNKEYTKARFYKKKGEFPIALNESRYITNAPLPRKRFIYYELQKLLQSAKVSIDITTPYFLPNNRILSLLKRAGKRGVNVRILLPHSTDHPMVDAGSKTFFTTLLKSKVKIFCYETMIHSKTFAIDGTVASVGSMNFDNVSLLYNFEGNLISTNKCFVEEIENHFNEDLKLAKEIKLAEWQKRPLFQKIFEAMVFPFRKFL
ncbi:MAG: cardiolipin synthase [Patescibacteria group bacterium]|jgi:cardiolipin synthase|nr:cardiolipin synthase [Patescibacteria group bacterium]